MAQGLRRTGRRFKIDSRGGPSSAGPGAKAPPLAPPLSTALTLAAIVAVAPVADASANTLEAERGRALAQTWCSQCHVIGDPAQAGALADAPSFRSLASRDDFSEAMLRRALLQPHPVMPDFPLTSRNVAELAAYLRSLTPEDAEEASEEQRTDAETGSAPTPTPTPMPVRLARHIAPPSHETVVDMISDDVEEGAAPGTLVEAGAALAQNCSPCHAIEGPGPSPVADAPAFSTLSQFYPVEHLAEALAEGIVVNHPTVQMPEFVLEPSEVAALIAFLESVQSVD